LLNEERGDRVRDLRISVVERLSLQEDHLGFSRAAQSLEGEAVVVPNASAAGDEFGCLAQHLRRLGQSIFFGEEKAQRVVELGLARRPIDSFAQRP
jgi:hypothetical protein